MKMCFGFHKQVANTLASSFQNKVLDISKAFENHIKTIHVHTHKPVLQMQRAAEPTEGALRRLWTILKKRKKETTAKTLVNGALWFKKLTGTRP